MKIFVDTWGWISLIDNREAQHRSVNDLIEGLRPPTDTIYTSDYVLDETITFLFRRISLPKAIDAVRLFEESENLGYLNVEFITPDRFKADKALRFTYSD